MEEVVAVEDAEDVEDIKAVEDTKEEDTKAVDTKLEDTRARAVDSIVRTDVLVITLCQNVTIGEKKKQNVLGRLYINHASYNGITVIFGGDPPNNH